jgi:predicted phosphodiesterase
MQVFNPGAVVVPRNRVQAQSISVMTMQHSNNREIVVFISWTPAEE